MAFPEGITAPVQYGHHIRSIVVYLQQYQLLPFGRTSELIEDLPPAPTSTGTPANTVSSCSERIFGAMDEIKGMIQEVPVAHFNESGVSINGKLHWFHAASTDAATYY